MDGTQSGVNSTGLDVQLTSALEYVPFDGRPDAGLRVSPQPAPAWGPIAISYTLTAAQAGRSVLLRVTGQWGVLTKIAPNLAGLNQVAGIYDWNYSSLGNRIGPFTVELVVDGAVVAQTPLLFIAP